MLSIGERAPFEAIRANLSAGLSKSGSPFPVMFALERFRYSLNRKSALCLCFHAIADAKPLRTFAGIALARKPAYPRALGGSPRATPALKTKCPDTRIRRIGLEHAPIGVLVEHWLVHLVRHPLGSAANAAFLL